MMLYLLHSFISTDWDEESLGIQKYAHPVTGAELTETNGKLKNIPYFQDSKSQLFSYFKISDIDVYLTFDGV
jgi:hypothetical protein